MGAVRVGRNLMGQDGDRREFPLTGGFNERLYWAEEIAFALALKREGRFVVLWDPVSTSGRRLRKLSGVQLLAGGIRTVFSPVKMFTQRSAVQNIWYDSNRADDDKVPNSFVVRVSNGITLAVMLVLASGQFTAAMDCRGACLAPAMAQQLDCAPYHHLLDVAGGSGIYACAIVARHAHLTATVLEKSPVDRLASKAIAERGFAGQVSVATGDMFSDPFPTGCDIHLFSNVLHDWDSPQVGQLLAKSYAALVPGGMIVVHDAHINASKTGPLPVAAYSALLMTITEGKCYSQQEMTDFLTRAGFSDVDYSSTVADRSVMTARKP
ncbi:MAG: methyltransferase [Verrucomicrobiota bacterium]